MFMLLVILMIIGSFGIHLIQKDAISNVVIEQEKKNSRFKERLSKFRLSNREDYALDLEIMQKELDELRAENVALGVMLKKAGKAAKECSEDAVL